mmetsp:Transcript_24245/g.47025  ORF Transcript_24245/g.47025 Transcript_24245/m.47025 type:complete len:205 (-) Transcript_24245:68-682(-)
MRSTMSTSMRRSHASGSLLCFMLKGTISSTSSFRSSVLLPSALRTSHSCPISPDRFLTYSKPQRSRPPLPPLSLYLRLSLLPEPAIVMPRTDSTSENLTLLSLSIIASNVSFIPAKCALRNLRGLGTDVMELVDVRISSLMLSRAVLTMAGSASLMRSTIRASLSRSSISSGVISSSFLRSSLVIFFSSFLGLASPPAALSDAG